MQEFEWSIGIDLGGTKTLVASIGIQGQILEKLFFLTEAEKTSPEKIQEELIASILQLKKKMGSAPKGIGIGVAGQVNPQTGTILYAPNLYWRNIEIKHNLQNAFSLPIFVTNDVRAAAWGEWLYGAGKGYQDVVCLYVGTGIGGAIISEGRMLNGSSYTIGELGHITIDVNGPICPCGNRGCFEAIGGGAALARHTQEAVMNSPNLSYRLLEICQNEINSLNTHHLFHAYQEGDPLSVEIMEKARQAWIAGSVSIINGFNPRCLVIGGGIASSFPEFLPWVEQGVRERALKAATKELEILPASLGNEAGVIGAGFLAHQHKEHARG